MHCSADFFCGKKTLAIILRMLHNEKRKETTQKGMKQPTVHKGNDIEVPTAYADAKKNGQRMTMKKESRRNISKKTVYFGIVFTAAGFALLAVLFAMTGKQNSTMSRLLAEREEQQRKLQEAEIQQEGLEELNAYISSSEFLIRYMRETQGYMLDGDIRFDVDDPNAIITTSVPISSAPVSADAHDTPEPAEPTAEP